MDRFFDDAGQNRYERCARLAASPVATVNKLYAGPMPIVAETCLWLTAPAKVNTLFVDTRYSCHIDKFSKTYAKCCGLEDQPSADILRCLIRVASFPGPMRFQPVSLVSIGCCAVGIAAIAASWHPGRGWQRAPLSRPLLTDLSSDPALFPDPSLNESVSRTALMSQAGTIHNDFSAGPMIAVLEQPAADHPEETDPVTSGTTIAEAETVTDEPLAADEPAPTIAQPPADDATTKPPTGFMPRVAALIGLGKPSTPVEAPQDGQPATARALLPVPAKKPADAEMVASLARGLSDTEPGDRLIEKPVEVGRGDTLIKLLVGEAVPRDEAISAIDALRQHYNPRRLMPGQKFSVLFQPSAQHPAQPIFVGLRIDPDIDQRVEVSRQDEGGFTAKMFDRPLQKVPEWAMATIDTSLMEAGKKAHVPPAVLVELIRAFSYDIDFQRDLQPGDRFIVQYDQMMTADGRVARAGQLHYAALIAGGRKLEVFRLVTPDGRAEYYDSDGHSVRKSLLRTPVEGARVSSGYGMRTHPILGFSKMHRGVDFAAPKGTPIYAAGDGVIERAGRYSSYGNYIRIHHNGSLSTAYAHLSRIGRGIKPGTRVRQGQLIGYVGMTGRATGPHLHYEVLVNNKQVNPMGISLPVGHALAGADLKRFKNEIDQLRNDAQQVASRRGFGIQLAEVSN